jgi:hypothetical protein
MTGGARVVATEGGGRWSGLDVGRCWAKSVSGLRAQKKKKSGLRAGLGCGAGLEAAWAAELGWKRPAREGV